MNVFSNVLNKEIEIVGMNNIIKDYIYYANNYKVISPFTSGSYQNTWDEEDKYYLIKLTEAVIVTEDNNIVIAAHGTNRGDVLNYEKIIDVINDPLYKNYKKYIHCCFQKQVSEKHPELKEFLLDPENDKFTGASIVLYASHQDEEKNISEKEFNGFIFLDNYEEFLNLIKK